MPYEFAGFGQAGFAIRHAAKHRALGAARGSTSLEQTLGDLLPLYHASF